MVIIIWALSRCKEPVKRFSPRLGEGKGEGSSVQHGKYQKEWKAALLRDVRAYKTMLLSFTCTILICCCYYKACPE